MHVAVYLGWIVARHLDDLLVDGRDPPRSDRRIVRTRVVSGHGSTRALRPDPSHRHRAPAGHQPPPAPHAPGVGGRRAERGPRRRSSPNWAGQTAPRPRASSPRPRACSPSRSPGSWPSSSTPGRSSRHRDPRDRRQARLGLTPAGKDALAREARERDRWLAEAMTLELSPAERALLRSAADLVTRLCETPPPLTEAELPPSAVPILPTHDARRHPRVPRGAGLRGAPGERRRLPDGGLARPRAALPAHARRRSVPDRVERVRVGAGRRRLPPGGRWRHGRSRRDPLVVLEAGDGAGDPVALRTRWERERSVARIGPPEDKPWRVRELALFDPTGNLLRVGHPIGLHRRLVTGPSPTA